MTTNNGKVKAVRKAKAKAKKDLTPEVKAEKIVAPNKADDVTVAELLDQLRNETDLSRKKTIRRQLRLKGHRGGLRGAPSNS